MTGPRPELRDLPPALHGGDAPEGVVDFSTGVSPLAPPPRILSAIRDAEVTRYPHPTALPLCEALAQHHRVSAAQIVAGAGSVELIWALARAFGGPGRRVGFVRPAFGEYRQAGLASGAEVVAAEDLPPLSETSIAFVARPSNPLMSLPELPATFGPLLVVDEAYQPLCEDVAPVRPQAHLAVLRSLTKIFALPGLRLGYLIAAPEVAAAVRASLPPWNVSQPAIAAGLASLDEPQAPIRQAIGELRARLVSRLASLGVEPLAARGSFVIVDVGDAAAFSTRLVARGCRVRDCSSFGLPRLVRVGVRSDADQERLIAAWRS